MTGTARVISESLGGSPLARAILDRRLPARLQPWTPGTIDEWREHASRTRAAGAWLQRLAPALSASGAARARLERTAEARGVVVTTGQQPGLFGGPVYTLAKALTALTLADALERDLGIPVAPIFWAATDDADFAEAAHVYAADAEGLHHFQLQAAVPAGTPMSAVPLTGMDALVEELRRRCGSAAHAWYFETARRAFLDSPTLGAAYVALLRALLEPMGIAVLEASHPAYHDAARPFLLETLDRADAIASALARRGNEIRAAGYEPQVADDRGLSLVFVLDRGLRRRLGLEEAARFARSPAGSDEKRRRRTRDDGRSATVLTPNVLLRPIVERELLPTVAYVGGPGELSYFTQANAVAEALERPPLVAVARWSGTIIEPFAERALDRLGVDYGTLRDQGAHTVERKLAEAAVPDRVAAAWVTLNEQVRQSVRALGEAVAGESLMPPEVIQGLERSLAHKLSRAERRILAAVKRRDMRVRRDLRVATGALLPLGKRQERMLSWIPMLARGGEPLLRELRRAIEARVETLVGAARTEPVTTR